MRTTHNEISFCESDRTTSFYLRPVVDGQRAGQMYFAMLNQKDNEDDASTASYFSLDELEYLANRILDAVEYERRHIRKPMTEEDKEQMIVAAVARHYGDTKKAAEELGVSERTIYRYLHREYKHK